ncbi:hypothetical protein FB45DRAFT_1115989 [Roridomyces roridus]|uniref:F-box domain-containing protein n=1 Tax=Roridomyces roridus TaxID=1738132 RepID=A0AAD7CDX6_9AGAR|nr:hypothetical protein FB45DRAFT_1115989 [Roridomyces roridus]
MSSSTSAKLRSRLAEIERGIVFHETQLGLLRTERESVERHLHAIATYPVLTLPNEITSEIFIQWLETDEKSNPMHLTWICKLWRAVAISTPQLWAHLKNVPRGFPDLNTWTWVILPRLVSIHCADSFDPALLGYLTLPALEDLIARSQCSIRKLDISAYFAGHERLRGFLELPGLRSIQDLTLRGSDGTDGALEELFLQLETPSFLPLLESFAVHGCEFLIPLPAVVNMLQARTERAEGEAKLRSFQLLFGGDYSNGWEDAQIDNLDASVEMQLNKIRGLDSQGLKVDIQSNFKFWNSYIDPNRSHSQGYAGLDR